MYIGCFCEKLSHEYFTIAGDNDYTTITVNTADRKVDNQMTLTAYGEGSATFAPKFCPFCGRKIRDKSLFQFGMNDSFDPVMSEVEAYKLDNKDEED
jgi:sarcosine oxidase delta subunit